MRYQLLLRNSSSASLAELFARGQCLEFPSAPFAVSHRQDLPEGVALEFREEAGLLQVKNCGSAILQMGEASLAPGQEAPMPPGEALVIGDRQMRLYRIHGRPGISRAANAVGGVALIGVCLALFLEFGAVVRLPALLKNNRAIRQQIQLQQLVDRVDHLRGRLRDKKLDESVAGDSLATSYLASLRAEMEARVRFLREHGEDLTAEERQEHLENLVRLDAMLDRLEANPHVTPVLPEVRIDDSVRHLIETR